jgi:hypothetical protein
MCNLCRENEWKLQIIRLFSNSKCHNSVTYCSVVPRIERNLDIRVINHQISFHSVQPERRQWKETANYWNFPKFKGHNFVKRSYPIQNWSTCRYSYDKSVYRISFQYISAKKKKKRWTETANSWNFPKSRGHNSLKIAP